MERTFRFNIVAILVGLLLPSTVALASGLELKVTAKEPPEQLAKEIRETLDDQAIQLLNGEEPVYEFWFRKELPLKSKPSSPQFALDAIRETTLLGAVVASRQERDYRDDDLYSGVYTMRFGLQPQDGNHLGTSEFPYFAVLIPAELDQGLDAIETYQEMVDSSREDTATDHPIILSLRPPSESGKDLPKITEPAPDHKAVLSQVPAKVPDSSESTEVLFELVYEGKSEH